MTKNNKRWRMPKAKAGELKIAYGKEAGNNPELFYCWQGEPGNRSGKGDSVTLIDFFNHAKIDNKNLIQELEERGYDITTLKFSIIKKSSTDN